MERFPASASAGASITVDGVAYNPAATYGPGTYEIIATAPGGNPGDICGDTTSVTITEPIAVTVSASATNVSCNGEADGTISASASAGASITVDGVAYNPAATYGPGTYEIIATAPGGNPGDICGDTTSVTITEPNPVTVSASGTNVTCNGEADGTITASASAGASITVDGVAYNPAATYGPGTYEIIATAPGGNPGDICGDTTSVTITEPIAVTVSASATNVSCNGEADGTITASASAGASITVDGVAYNPAATYGPGTYEIIATAPGGNPGDICGDTTSVTITEPIAVTVSASATNVSCNGEADGTITASASAGASITVDGVAYNPAATYGPGTYEIIATAPGGNPGDICGDTTSVTITEPIAVTVSASSTNVSCNGEADGTISASASAGASITVDGVAYNPAATYGPGTYEIIATAPGGNPGDVCGDTTSVTITEPNPIALSVSSTNVTCNGENDGTITASAVSGATITVDGNPYNAADTYGPGTYEIIATAPGGNPGDVCGDTTSVTITDSNPASLMVASTNVTCNGENDGTITASAVTGASITVDGNPYNPAANYGPGTYEVIATVPGGNPGDVCGDTISVTITEPIAVTVSASATNVSCNGEADGTISASASAGASITVDGVAYNPAATYGPGTYEIIATAPGGNPGDICGDTTSVTITEPIAVTVSASATNVSCNGEADGTISASASAGASITVDGVAYNPAATYGPGTYEIIATAPGGNPGDICGDTTSVTITEPNPVTVSASGTNVTCNGEADGTITASASAGASITVDGVAYNPAATYGPGTYEIIATAPGGNPGDICGDTTSVTITEPMALSCSIAPFPGLPACGGQTSNSLTASVMGGTGTKTYSWSIVAIDAGGVEIGNASTYGWSIFSGQGTNQINFVAGDTYRAKFKLTVTDANLCETVCETIVDPCSHIEVLKTTCGVVEPSKTWNFDIYIGPDGFGGTLIASDNTFADGDGVMEFGFTNLDPNETYTICELEAPAGYTVTWNIDTDNDGIVDMVLTDTYNPNADDPMPENMGNICLDFGAGTPYPIVAGGSLIIEIDNCNNGSGGQRTPGYWKNWSTCSNGNQVQTAANNGGPSSGFYLLDDLLYGPTIGWCNFTFSSCQEGVDILDYRDLNSGKKRASDPAYKVARNLLAAQLNIAAGAETCQAILDAVADAETLLCSINFDGTGSYFKAKGKNKASIAAQAQYANDLASILDDYNNGLLCGVAPKTISPLVINLMEIKVYPNPASENIMFEVLLPERMETSIEVYNMLGQRIDIVYQGWIEEEKATKIKYHVSNLPEGTYMYKIITNSDVKAGKFQISR